MRGFLILVGAVCCVLTASQDTDEWDHRHDGVDAG